MNGEPKSRIRTTNIRITGARLSVDVSILYCRITAPLSAPSTLVSGITLETVPPMLNKELLSSEVFNLVIRSALP
ncbi:hypothetical protein D3C81_1557650 [compost metagenome]